MFGLSMWPPRTAPQHAPGMSTVGPQPQYQPQSQPPQYQPPSSPFTQPYQPQYPPQTSGLSLLPPGGAAADPATIAGWAGAGPITAAPQFRHLGDQRQTAGPTISMAEIEDFLQRNPGDEGRIASAFEITQDEVDYAMGRRPQPDPTLRSFPDTFGFPGGPYGNDTQMYPFESWDDPTAVDASITGSGLQMGDVASSSAGADAAQTLAAPSHGGLHLRAVDPARTFSVEEALRYVEGLLGDLSPDLEQEAARIAMANGWSGQGPVPGAALNAVLQEAARRIGGAQYEPWGGGGGGTPPGPGDVVRTNPPDGCFAAGTLISTPKGARPIESLKVGDEVWGVLRNGRTAAVPIVAVHKTTGRPRTLLFSKIGRSNRRLDGLRTLRVTDAHPIFDGLDYIPAGQWKVGDVARGVPPGELLRVGDPVTADEPVYNLTVGGLHTYLANGIHVHNKTIVQPGSGRPPGPPPLPPRIPPRRGTPPTGQWPPLPWPPGQIPPGNTDPYRMPVVGGGVGGDPLSEGVNSALMGLLDFEGTTAFGDELSRYLMGLVQSGGTFEGEDRGPIGADLRTAIDMMLEEMRGGGDDQLEFERAREMMERGRRTSLNAARADLASRGLLSEPGIEQGVEAGAIGRINERLGADFATALRDIAINRRQSRGQTLQSLVGASSELARLQQLDQSQLDQRMLTAMQLATGMSATQVQAMLQAAGSGNERQAMLAQIALQSLQQNQAWAQFLAEFGLERDQVMYEMEQGNISAIMPLINAFLQIAGLSRGGFI